MELCLLAKIGRQEVSFWYSNGGTVAPLVYEDSAKVPLFFLVTTDGVQTGEAARAAYVQNHPDAYANYFELITDPSLYFTIFGDKKPIKKLFYFAIESFIKHLLHRIAFKNDPIETYRYNFCLRFWFDMDVNENEQVFIEKLFREAGYENVSRIDYYSYIKHYLDSVTQDISSWQIIYVTAINNDLFFKYFRKNNYENSLIDSLQNVGSDPRTKILAKLILEDILSSNPSIYLTDEKQELEHIQKNTRHLLKGESPKIEGELLLSTGRREGFRVTRKELNTQLSYNEDFQKIYRKLDDIILEQEFSNEFLALVIIGEEINTTYFLEKFKSKFATVLSISEDEESKILTNIFQDIVKNGYKLQRTSNYSEPNSDNTNLNSTPRPILPPPPQPKVQTTEKLISKPTAPPIPKPVSKPTAPPIPKPVSKPTAPPIPKPVSKPAAPPIPKPVSKPTAPPIPKPVSKPTAPPIPKPVSKPTAPPVPKSSALNVNTFITTQDKSMTSKTKNNESVGDSKNRE